MKFELLVISYVVFLFAGMMASMEVGRRFGRSRLHNDPAGFDKGTGAVEGAVFGLLGLIIAFTFSGAASRLESRRHLITEEANAIGTAYLRIDLLPENSQSGLRELFREYLDLRLETYQNASNLTEALKLYDTSVLWQDKIWDYSVLHCESTEGSRDACKLLLPSLNDMIDITTTRLMATRLHPPLIIYLLMGFLCLLGAALAGYGMASNQSRNALYMIVFSVVMSVTVFVILDLEYPRLGFIKISDADQVLIDLRNSMK